MNGGGGISYTPTIPISSALSVRPPRVPGTTILDAPHGMDPRRCHRQPSLERLIPFGAGSACVGINKAENGQRGRVPAA